MNKKIILTVIITLLIAGGAGFYGGVQYGKGNGSQANLTNNFQNFQGRRGNMQQNGGFTAGEIIKKDDTSITVKLNNGSSQIILFSDATKVMKSTDGSFKDLAMGEQVTVAGSKNQDGSLTAQSIQIRPTLQNNQ